MQTRIFNFMNSPFVQFNPELFSKDFQKVVDEPMLIDDVDTSILSFLKAYGEPPHLEFEDDGDDDPDFSDIGYDDDDDVVDKDDKVADVVDKDDKVADVVDKDDEVADVVVK